MSNLESAKLNNSVKNEKRLDPLLAKKKAMDKLLTRKRDAMNEFFSNKLSMIFLIILAVGLVFGLYNNISTTIVEIQNNELGLNIITAIIDFVLGFFVPVGFALVYFGSKKQLPTMVKSGMLYISKYFGFVRLLAILVGLGLGIFLAVSLPFGGFVNVLILLYCFATATVSVLVLNIFSKFIERMSSELNREYTFFPDAKNIRTYTIVIFAIYIVFGILNLVVLSNSDGLVALLPQAESLLVSEGLSKVLSYFAFVITGSVLGFLVYYLNAYFKFFTKFNEEHKAVIDGSK